MWLNVGIFGSSFFAFEWLAFLILSVLSGFMHGGKKSERDFRQIVAWWVFVWYAIIARSFSYANLK